MDKVTSLCILTIGCVLVFGSYACTYPLGTVVYATDYYPIYYADGPFGIFYTEAQGKIGGIFLIIKGTYTSELNEAYVIKYFVGNELRTIFLKAEDTPIVFDGTFKLEKMIMGAKYQSHKRGEWVSPLNVKTYRIHLPHKPVLNQTISLEWNIVVAE